MCLTLPLVIQGYHIKDDFYILPVAACQVVLGVQWLETLWPIEMNYRQLTMSFKEGEATQTLHGIKQPGLYALVGKEFHHMHDTSLFLQMVAVHDHETPTKHSFNLTKILNKCTQVLSQLSACHHLAHMITKFPYSHTAAQSMSGLTGTHIIRKLR